MSDRTCPCVNCVLNKAQGTQWPCVNTLPPATPQGLYYNPSAGLLGAGPSAGNYGAGPSAGNLGAGPSAGSYGAGILGAGPSAGSYGAGPSPGSYGANIYQPGAYVPGPVPGQIGTAGGYYNAFYTPQSADATGGQPFYGAATGAAAQPYTYMPQGGTPYYSVPQTGIGKGKANKPASPPQDDYEVRFREIANMDVRALSELVFDDGSFIDVGYAIAMCLLRKTLWDDKLFFTSTQFAIPNLSNLCIHAYQIVVISSLSVDEDTVTKFTGVAQNTTFYADNLASYQQALCDVLTDVVISYPGDAWTGIVQLFILIKQLGLYLCKYLRNEPHKRNAAICHLKEQILRALDLCTNTYSDQPQYLDWAAIVTDL